MMEESNEGRWDYVEGDSPTEQQTQSDPDELERARIRMKAEKDSSEPHDYQKGQEADIEQMIVDVDERYPQGFINQEVWEIRDYLTRKGYSENDINQYMSEMRKFGFKFNGESIAKEESTISVSGPPAGTQPPANIWDELDKADEEFREEDHPRDGGKFTSKGGGDSEKDDEDTEFEKSHGMQSGQVRVNRLDGIRNRIEHMSDKGKTKAEKLRKGKNLADMTNKEIRDYHMKIGGIEVKSEEEFDWSSIPEEDMDKVRIRKVKPEEEDKEAIGELKANEGEDWSSMNIDELKKRRDQIEEYVEMSDATNTWESGRKHIAEIDNEIRKRSEETIGESYATEEIGGVCPICKGEVGDMYDHIKSDHPEYLDDFRKSEISGYEVYEKVDEVKTPEYKISYSMFGWESLPFELQTRLGRGLTKVNSAEWGTMTEAERKDKLTEIGEDPKDIKLLSDLLDNELAEQEAGEDEKEDIENLLRLLAPEAVDFKEEEHPRDQGGQFTSKGGGVSSAEKPKEKEFTLKDYEKNESRNYHARNAFMLVEQYGTPEEIKEMEEINKRHSIQGSISGDDYKRRYEISNKYYDNLVEDSKKEPKKEPPKEEPMFKTTKPKNIKKFNTIKAKILQDLGEPTEDYYKRKKDVIQRLDGFPTSGKQIEGLGVRYKAPLMKLHLQEEHPTSNWSVRTEYFSGGSAIDAKYTGGEYPYGATKVGDVYSQTGAGYDPQTDYFPIDNYVHVYDGRPYEGRPRGDPQTIAKDRPDRLRSWIQNRLENVDYNQRYNWSDTVAKDLVEKDKLIPFSDMTEDHKNIIINTWNEFKEQERKEKSGESYKKKASELDDIYSQFTGTIDAPTGKNIMDSTRGYSEPEADGQDLTGTSIDKEAFLDPLEPKHKNKLDFSDFDEKKLEDFIEDDFTTEGENDDLQGFNGEPSISADEEIIEKIPPKIKYHYYKQHPFGVRKDDDSPFGNEVSLDTMNQAHVWWDNKYPERQWSDMTIGERQRVILAFLRDPDTALEGGQGSGRKPYASKDPNRRDKAHIGWKNYGIDELLDQAMQDYLEKSEEQEAPTSPSGEIPPTEGDTDDKDLDDLTNEEQIAQAGHRSTYSDYFKSEEFEKCPEGQIWDAYNQKCEKDIKLEPLINYPRAEEGGKGSGKKGHQSWMRSIEEDPSYGECKNCKVITEKVNGKCQMCGKKVN